MPEPSVSSPAIYQLRVVLCGVSPLVWRRLLLAELHEILQRAFGWGDEHLHRFLIHGAAYGVPRLGGIACREDARRVPLSRFRLHGGERFRYEYDFTVDWNSEGDRQAIGDLDELREAIDRVEAYRAFQPDRFNRRALNRQLRALAQEGEVRR